MPASPPSSHTCRDSAMGRTDAETLGRNLRPAAEFCKGILLTPTHQIGNCKKLDHSARSTVQNDLNFRPTRTPVFYSLRPTASRTFCLDIYCKQFLQSLARSSFVRRRSERETELAKFIGRVQCLICPLGAARETATTSTSASLIRIHISQREVQGRAEVRGGQG